MELIEVLEARVEGLERRVEMLADSFRSLGEQTERAAEAMLLYVEAKNRGRR